MAKCMFDTDGRKCNKVAVKKEGKVWLCKHHYDVMTKYGLLGKAEPKRKHLKLLF